MDTTRNSAFGKFITASLTAIVSFAALPALAETIPVYTYHNHPPFVLEAGKGLSYDFVEFLNKKSKGNPSFKLEVVSRSQLDKTVATPDFSGVIAWVSPNWFNDKNKTTYLWSNQTMEDANVILSNASKKVEYKDPASLKGKTLGGIVGHKYAGIDDLVTAGDIKREDADKERSNLRKLEAGRIDVTLLPRTTAKYLVDEMNLGSKVYIAPTAHSSYTRHVMISKNHPEVQKLVNDAIADMSKDAGWQTTLAKYRAK